MIKILIVDDEVEICDFLKRFFEDRGFSVYCSNSGEEALKVADSVRPEIMLLDVRMPVMDGIETLKRVKKKHNDINVIMVTADDDPSIIETAKSLGVVQYITKPLVLGDLEKSVLTCASTLNK